MKEELDPKSKEELANLLLQIGFKEEAVTELLTAATIYEKGEDKEKAVSIYQRVLENDPRNRVAIRRLEELAPEILTPKPTPEEITAKLEKSPEKSEILSEFKKYKEELKDDAQKRTELAKSFLEAGMIEEAKENLEKALKIEKIPSAISLLAQIYSGEGEKDRAKDLLKEGLKLPYTEEEKNELYYQLALVYHSLGNIPLALEEINRVPSDYKDSERLRERWKEELPEEEKIPEVVPEKFPVVEEAPPEQPKPEEEVKELGEENISFL